MMPKRLNLTHKIALDEQNALVVAENASKGDSFHCPDCQGVVLLRKGKIRIPHFAHKSLTPNCTPETVLHKLGKDKIKEIVEKIIADKEQCRVEHRCSECLGIHRYDLIENVARVELERALSIVRPDVSLLDSKNSTLAVIEVVVTHAPEEKTLEVFKEAGILYIRVDLRSYMDLEFIEEKIKHPINSNTFGCHRLLNTFDAPPEPEVFSQMFIYDYPCDYCGEDTKVALIDVQENFFEIKMPDGFSNKELVTAQENGVLIGKHKFSQNGDVYTVFKCSNCGNYPSKASRSGTLDNLHYHYSKNEDRAKIINL